MWHLCEAYEGSLRLCRASKRKRMRQTEESLVTTKWSLKSVEDGEGSSWAILLDTTDESTASGLWGWKRTQLAQAFF